MDSPRPLVTANELLGMSSPGKRYALIRGEVIEMEPSGGRHGQVAAEIAACLLEHVKRNGLGTVFAAETGFRLEKDPDTVLAPDVAFVARGRISGRAPQGYPDLAPDLVVEVVSPRDRPGVVDEKARSWNDHGVAVVWIVDPEARTVSVHEDGRPPRILTDGDRISHVPRLPGFECCVKDFFS